MPDRIEFDIALALGPVPGQCLTREVPSQKPGPLCCWQGHDTEAWCAFLFGDPHSMHCNFRMPRSAWVVMSLPVVLSAGLIAGCDSGGVDSPEAKATSDAQKAVAQKTEDEINASIKKSGGKKAGSVKLMGKPGAGVGKAE